jgi:hypothetical protein
MELKPNFEKDLWGQCNKLHDRLTQKRKFYKNLMKIIDPIAGAISELKKKLNLIKIDNDPTFPLELNTNSDMPQTDSIETNMKLIGIPLTIKTIIIYMFDSVDTYFQILTNINNIILDLTKKMEEEKNKYNDYKSCINSYSESKKVVEKNKKAYYQKMGAAEKSVKDLKELQIKRMAINDDSIMNDSKDTLNVNANQLINEAIKYYNLYKDSVNKANDIREESIKKQKALLFMYQNLENDVGKTNVTFLSFCIMSLDLQKSSLETKKEEIEKISKTMNVEKDIKQLIISFAGKEKPEDEIPFINFTSILDFDKCDNWDDYEINKQTIEYIQEKLEEEYPNYNKEFEFIKSDLRETLYKLFKKYDEEGKNKISEYIKDNNLHYYFLILLSKLRTHNRFKQEEQLINFLGVTFNYILDEAEKDKNYDIARNCIILSQTFFSLEDDKKHYLIEEIRNHKWFKTTEFWIGIIDLMIDKELDKFEMLHSEVAKEDVLKGSEDISHKMKFKLSELLFSQILPYVNNMKEFNLGLKNMDYVTEIFVHKYIYLSEEHKEAIYGLMSNDKELIEKFQKEFEKSIENDLKNYNKLNINTPISSSNNNNNQTNKKVNIIQKSQNNNISKNENINSIENNNNNIEQNKNKIEGPIKSQSIHEPKKKIHSIK